MLLSGFIRTCTGRLQALYPSREAGSIVQRLCCEKLGVSSYTHILEPSTSIPADMEAEMELCAARLEKGEPLQYVLGTAEFRGHRFNVRPGVLIPRPETEQLVEEALRSASTLDHPARVLDLCTGSGCIAWSVVLELPGSTVTATDISPEALEIAGSQYDLDGPRFILSDLLDPTSVIPGGPFDLLLSNPPYIMEKEKAEMHANVLDHEPALALFVPDNDPLKFYRAIAEKAGGLLVRGGKGIVEINERLSEETATLMEKHGLTEVRILRDLFGKNRFVSFCKPL